MTAKRHMTRDKTHISPRQFLPPLLLAGSLTLGITAVFFRMGWHVPDDMQPIVSVVIYVLMCFISMWCLFTKLGVYKEN
jgi:hypothetical protein